MNGFQGLLQGGLESPLASLGAGLLANSGWSTVPISTGQALGVGYQNMLNQQRQLHAQQAGDLQLGLLAAKQKAAIAAQQQKAAEQQKIAQAYAPNQIQAPVVPGSPQEFQQFNNPNFTPDVNTPSLLSVQPKTPQQLGMSLLATGDPASMAKGYSLLNDHLKGSDLVQIQGPNGQPVYVQAQNAVGKQAYQKPTGDGMKVRDQKIQALMARGLSASQAQDIVDRNLHLITNPLTGQTGVYNPVNGSTQPINIPAPAVSAPTAGAPTGTPTKPGNNAVISDANAVGVVPMVKDAIAKTAGQFIPGLDYPEVTQARQRLNIAREMLAQTFTAGGRRPTTSEQQRILELFPSMGAWANPRHAVEKLSTLADTLKQQIDSQVAYMNDPQNPLSSRKNAGEEVRKIQQVYDMLVGHGKPTAPQPNAGKVLHYNPATGKIE